MSNGVIKLDERLDSIEVKAEHLHECLHKIGLQMERNTGVLEQIRDQLDTVAEMKIEISGLRTDITVVKTKSGWIGVIATVIAVAVAAVIEYLRH